MAMLTSESWPGISQSTHCAKAGDCTRPGRAFKLNEGRERRMIQRYSRPGRVEGARGLHAFCIRRGRGVSGGACDPTLQANRGEAAEPDHNLRRGSRPKGMTD